MSLISKANRMRACMRQIEKQCDVRNMLFEECRPFPDYPDEPEECDWANGGDDEQICIDYPDVKKAIVEVKDKIKRYESLRNIVADGGYYSDWEKRSDIGEELDEMLEILEEVILPLVKIQSFWRMYITRKNGLYAEHLKYKPDRFGYFKARDRFNAAMKRL